ncbi:hypothetical protein [Luteimonas aquatica]|uniref:hypothetical protein n=1 Tax=Luteimonas aquatica TaxID=450364 RepID=UPI001F5706D8|nr:hypothetical protein [Luteimonas aquatica]
MSDELDNSDEADALATNGGAQASPRPRMNKLVKVIPTDRVSFDKQMSVLRAYAAASGPEKKAVSNDEVSAVISGLAASSISLCNPYLSDCGFLIAEGRKQRPVDAVFDYLHAYEWNPDTAATKLRGIMAETWAAKELLPKLGFRQLSKDEAIQFLADASKAQKGHRRNLETVLDYLGTTGVVNVDGNTVSKVSGAPLGNDPPPPPPAADDKHKGGQRTPKSDDVEHFTIPIPGKEAAVITVPKNLDADDWDMLSTMIGTYIARMRKDSTKGSAS